MIKNILIKILKATDKAIRSISSRLQKNENTVNQATVWWVTFWSVIAIIFLLFGDKEIGINGWGDFFAGVFAPLAFAYLILGYHQQRKELQQNTEALLKQKEALDLQAKELNASVEQQKEMVRLSKEQFELQVQSADRNHYKQKLDAQPRFKFIHLHDPELHDKTLETYIQIENFGATATDIKFTVLEQNNITIMLKPDAKELGFWFNGETKKLEVSMTNLSGRFLIHSEFSVKILIEFKDSIGELSSTFMHFQKSPSSHPKTAFLPNIRACSNNQ